MQRIMFVCHGNICRSPMAEFILRELAQKRGRAGDFSIASAATSDEEIPSGVGNPVYPPAREELARHGLSCHGKRATLLRRADYAEYDLFLCMDDANVRNARRILGGDPAGKVRKLCARDVADPWYTGRFDVAYRDIYEGCTALLHDLDSEEVCG